MGGGAHYPYPKDVWSPSGGWWTRPSTWRANTAICIVGIATATYGVWRISARNEKRHIAPTKAIPSARWSAHAKEIGVREGYA